MGQYCNQVNLGLLLRKHQVGEVLVLLLSGGLDFIVDELAEDLLGVDDGGVELLELGILVLEVGLDLI